MKITTTDRKKADAVFLKYLIYVTTTKTKKHVIKGKRFRSRKQTVRTLIQY